MHLKYLKTSSFNMAQVGVPTTRNEALASNLEQPKGSLSPSKTNKILINTW